MARGPAISKRLSFRLPIRFETWILLCAGRRRRWDVVVSTTIVRGVCEGRPAGRRVHYPHPKALTSLPLIEFETTRELPYPSETTCCILAPEPHIRL